MRRQILILCLLVSIPTAATAQNHRYEAETGTMIGTVVSNSFPGYSGTGYVTGFDNANGQDRFQLQANIPAGLYELWVGHRSPHGEKGYTFSVNGETGSGMFDQTSSWSTDRAGLFSIPGGTSTLGIQHNWGWYDIDYLEFRPFTPPAIQPVSTSLVDANANPRTQWLMNYLNSQYGQKTFSGQQHSVSQNLAFPGNTYLSKSGGLLPAIRGSDLIEYSPTRLQYGANPRNESEQTIQWAQETGGIVTMAWHWNAPANLVNTPCGQSCGENDWPWWRGFYAQGSNFNLPAALANTNGSDYQLILRDIDAAAVQLKKFQDAGVPVLWRPLHEAQGQWFWWGEHGPTAFKQLWNLMHDRMTNHHGLHNLIWEYTSTGVNEEFLNWYPGDHVVDMIGADIYTDPSSSMSGEWYDLLEIFNGRKLVALSETGTLPNPDVMDQWGIEWNYFAPWNGTFIDAMTPAQLQHTLGHEDVISLDELLVTPWKQNAAFQGADLNFDGDVNEVDLAIWQNAYGSTYAGDTDLDGDTDGRDFLIWMRQFSQIGELTQSLTIPEPSSGILIISLIAAGRPLLRNGARLRFKNPKSATISLHIPQANGGAHRKPARWLAS
jgi:mannan endo-1,4-beta-mannosidase